MSTQQVEVATILEQWDGLETRGWYAWNDLMPPKPDFVHVIGEVLVPNPGVDPELTYREPQGINPAILFLDLRLHQKPGIWPDVLVWKTVRYGAVLSAVPYTRAIVFFNAQPLLALDIDTVHLTVTATDLTTAASAPAVPLPRRAGVASRGENPFPWSQYKGPFCISGSLVSAPPLDICMDGVPYILNVNPTSRIRVAPGNAAAKAALEDAVNKRIIITVCGRIAIGIEGGCHYLLAEKVSPAADFAAQLAS